jgi:adenylate cyclase class 2
VLEVESKYKSPGNDKVEKALGRLGARRAWVGAMEDVYYAHPSRDFGRTDEALRLRKTDEVSELTYKGPRMQSQTLKAREEITLRTDNPLAIARIIERLGFRESFVVRKNRSSYILDKLKIEVDDVEGLGEYVELEVLTESPDRSKQLVETARVELGLDRLEPRTYLEMLIEKMASERIQKQ